MNKTENKNFKRCVTRPDRALLVVLAMIVTSGAFAENLSTKDFGSWVEEKMTDSALELFGVKKAVTTSVVKPVIRSKDTKAHDLVMLAEGLQVEYLTRNAANRADMFAFWPDDNTPSHLIFCIEGDRDEIKPGKWNPSIQRINIKTGKVETIVRGMSGCDGIRRTPWGTILATEERPDGSAYELLSPLEVTGISVLDRAAGKVSDSSHLIKRTALPMIAWEGLTVLDNGVVIAGDELRPGTTATGGHGGSIFKFLPDKPFDKRHINTLDESPLRSGNVYALRVDCQSQTHRKFPQFGQGCEVGNAVWVAVSALTARRDASSANATGYYRPEDLHADPLYRGEGMRFCWTNTGNKQAANFGEVMCALDSHPELADTSRATVTVQRFIEGDQQFNSVDNLAFQPVTGNLYVLEDDQHGGIYACLPDGQDRDLMSDGCIHVMTVLDPTAEPTGFAFTGDGTTAYLSIQHSKDNGMPMVDDYPTDDILRITGFRLPKVHTATQ